MGAYLVYGGPGMGLARKGKWKISLAVGCLDISDQISKEDLKVLEDGLAAHTCAKDAPPLVRTPLSVLKRDEEGKIIAGLCAETYWNWCYIDSLWVREDLRGQGAGRALMEAMEKEVVRRDCVGIFLWTQSFDAPSFYQKLGYEEFVRWDDFPVAHQRYGFMKRLTS